MSNSKVNELSSSRESMKKEQLLMKSWRMYILYIDMQSPALHRHHEVLSHYLFLLLGFDFAAACHHRELHLFYLRVFWTNWKDKS
jgi:hypothetical protein